MKKVKRGILGLVIGLSLGIGVLVLNNNHQGEFEIYTKYVTPDDGQTTLILQNGSKNLRPVAVQNGEVTKKGKTTETVVHWVPFRSHHQRHFN